MQIQKTNGPSNTESSVLFSLASLGAMAKPAPAAVKPAAKVEDLLGIGATPSPVLAAPIVAPVVMQPAPSTSTRTWIACAVIVAIGILGGSYAAARAIQPTTRVVTIARGVEVPPMPEVAVTSPEVAPEIEPTRPEVVVASPEVAVPGAASEGRHPHPHHVDPVAVAAPVAVEPPHGALTLEQLVDRATHHTPEHATTPVPPPSTLPATPSRTDVMTAMTGITPSVSACGPDHGVATVQLTVSHTGRVTNAVVTGPLAGTPTGSCVARAARGAHFPEFSRETFSLTYPFRL